MVCLTIHRAVSGEQFCLPDVDLQTSVAEVKTKIEDYCHVPRNALQLLHGVTLLNDNSEQLAFACCTDGPVLSLTMLVSVQDLLTELLKGNEAARLESLHALSKLGLRGSEEVTSAVLRVVAVQGQSEEVKISAAHTLSLVAERGNTSAIDAMMAFLDDPGGYIRVAGLQALGSLVHKGDERVIAAVAALWDDWHPCVKFAAAETLQAIR
eukprot:TRINITY_DN13339_c0_g1_i2.p1 TRINITY_DN13339_c0_g1~~TRINITY_DN13339_c0_g1_i2.p1  ORF type:complete len:210 (-),score=48.41 TRINITY_DN13339_c0_g1_i2:13-642(-)